MSFLDIYSGRPGKAQHRCPPGGTGKGPVTLRSDKGVSASNLTARSRKDAIRSGLRSGCDQRHALRMPINVRLGRANRLIRCLVRNPVAPEQPSARGEVQLEAV